jgi:hypothetical protein
MTNTRNQNLFLSSVIKIAFALTFLVPVMLPGSEKAVGTSSQSAAKSNGREHLKKLQCDDDEKQEEGAKVKGTRNIFYAKTKGSGEGSIPKLYDKAVTGSESSVVVRISPEQSVEFDGIHCHEDGSFVLIEAKAVMNPGSSLNDLSNTENQVVREYKALDFMIQAIRQSRAAKQSGAAGIDWNFGSMNAAMAFSTLVNDFNRAPEKVLERLRELEEIWKKNTQNREVAVKEHKQKVEKLKNENEKELDASKLERAKQELKTATKKLADAEKQLLKIEEVRDYIGEGGTLFNIKVFGDEQTTWGRIQGRQGTKSLSSVEPQSTSSSKDEEAGEQQVAISNNKQGNGGEVFSDVVPDSNNPKQKDRATTSALGGIDFSTLELRYIAEDSGLFTDRSLKYAFNGVPAAGNKNLKAGRIAAAQASDAFFVWLSLSPDKFWVNLNPNEPDRIIDPQFGKTDAGRILLQSDLQMKKTVAKLIHPDTQIGKQYWQQRRNIGEQQPHACSLGFRMWIVPAPATVREDDNSIYIADAPLDVKLEGKYLNFKIQNLPKAYSDSLTSCTTPDKKNKALQEALSRKFILPRIAKAVNTAPEYAELRRVYRSRVAAEWYRQRSSSKTAAYRDMINNGDVSSWPARQNWSPKQVFNQYVNSVTKGEFHVETSDTWREGNIIYTQKYLYAYGGVDFTRVLFKQLNSTDFQKKWGNLQQVVDTSMKSPTRDSQGKIWLGGSTTLPSIPIWESVWFYLGLGVVVGSFSIYWIRTHREQQVFSLSGSQIVSAIGGKIIDITIAFVIVVSCGSLAIHFVSSFFKTYEAPEPALRNPELPEPVMPSPQWVTPKTYIYKGSPSPASSPQ